MVFGYFSCGEVFGTWVIEIPTAHAGSGVHGVAFGEDDAGRGLGAEKFEELRLGLVIRAGRVAGSRVDAAIFLADDVLHLQVFDLLVTGQYEDVTS